MFKYEIKEGIDEEENIVFLSGPITELAAKGLNDLLSRAKRSKNWVFNFKSMEYINSLGIRVWCKFLRSFSEGRNIVFEECPPTLVGQINTRKHVIGSASIKSFYGDFVCCDCDHEEAVLLQTADGIEKIEEICNSRKCEKCGAAMELDAELEEFLSFLE